MITAIVLTHNEEEMLLNCLKSIEWVDEILISDKKSTDSTLAIAQKYNAKIHHFTGVHFDDWRNQALEKTNGNWAIYIDPDERITKELKAEIQTILNENETSFVKSDLKSAYRMKRINYWWGKKFNCCGAENDFVTRLFNKSKLKKWRGIIHESPEVDGEIGQLSGEIIHLTHRDLISGLKKSYQWTKFEAELFNQTDHPKITWPRLLKIFNQTFWQKFIKQGGIKQGTEGFIESMVQAWNRFMVYEQLWELQQKPNLDEKYKEIEEKLSL
ncbi:hypothetical protein COX08_01320 [Candidatus Beckwithbacteria bacterium CG23_combo_of_CG06-09_8_20_14_all_34_8]|uniref:Glycosyltransferase 2-like domain-containing protein n=1 Tax=Candidatus Beckwithbacteria bacterium CG23_combo_of_CG06-09_8_20_14_all_34_8 TaxID=1974497 RepID=A0A2H0B6V0_9BACT|nr:MAG: hypothetical protein COX08_01320 [Candidatus Beckwithbacteria bacterium CG23_combo_of_CG06-09_8_20_14_all_34_8]